MPANKRKMDYDRQWQLDHTDDIRLKPNKAYNLPARIARAIEDGKAASRQAYIIDAVIQRLNREGYTNIDQQEQKDQ